MTLLTVHLSGLSEPNFLNIFTFKTSFPPPYFYISVNVNSMFLSIQAKYLESILGSKLIAPIQLSNNLFILSSKYSVSKSTSQQY